MLEELCLCKFTEYSSFPPVCGKAIVPVVPFSPGYGIKFSGLQTFIPGIDEYCTLEER